MDSTSPEFNCDAENSEDEVDPSQVIQKNTIEDSIFQGSGVHSGEGRVFAKSLISQKRWFFT